MAEARRANGHRRRLPVATLALAGALVMVASLWLPWHHSGERSRNAFDLIITVERLDVGPTVLDDLWRWLLPLVPVFGALAWTARSLGWRKLFSVAVAAVTIGAGLPAVLSLAIDGLQEPGEAVATIGLILVLSSLVVSLSSGPEQRKAPAGVEG